MIFCWMFYIFLGIFNLFSSLWDYSHLPLNQLDPLPPKEWSCVLFLPNFWTVWDPPMDLASSVYFTPNVLQSGFYCYQILKFLSHNSMLTSYLPNIKAHSQIYALCLLSNTGTVKIVYLIISDWSYSFLCDHVIFIECLNVWFLLCVSLFLPARYKFLESGSCIL